MSSEIRFGQIGLVQVLSGATPFKVNNVSDTYRGLVRTNDGNDTPAIIKDLPPRELANEVFAAALGHLIGLPLPKAHIGLATADRLDAQHGPALENGARLVFVSLDVSQPQVAMLCQGQSTPAVVGKLAQWSDLGLTYGFDALIANIDRHMGNILFNGDREVWLIDHGHAFTGPNWMSSDLKPPDKTVVSRLRQWLTPFLDQPQRSRVAGDAASVPKRLDGIDFDQMAAANYIGQLLPEPDKEALTQFLHDRLSHVPRLAAEAAEVLI